MTACLKQHPSVWSLSNNSLRSTTSKLQISTATSRKCRIQRYASSKATTAFPSRRHETLTLLHKTTNTVPSVFSFGDPLARQNRHTEQFWDDILSHVHHNLALPVGEPVKIVVLGLSEEDATKDLVTALLSDPLTSDQQQNDLISNRWEGRSSNQLRIVFNSDTHADPSSLQIPSSYLQQFSTPIQLTELRGPDSTQVFLSEWSQDHTQIPILHNPLIYKADIPIVVFNPLTTPLSTLLRNRLPSNVILVSSAPTSQTELSSIMHKEVLAVQEYFESKQRPPPQHNVEPLNIFSVDPQRALAAIRVLQSNSESYYSVQRFQDEYASSHLASLTQELRTRIDNPSPADDVNVSVANARIQDSLNAGFQDEYASSHLASLTQELRTRIDNPSPADDVNVSVANARIQDSLNAGFDYISTRLTELQEAIRDVDLLQHNTSANRAVIPEQVLGVDSAEVKDAIQRTEKDIRQVMDKLTWWKMIWRVDEISTIVSGALTQAWFHNLEKKLVFSAGKLSNLQDQLSARKEALLVKHKSVASQVLQNQLGQLQSAPSYKVTPSALTQPIISRRNQMIQFPTTRLHVSGQKAVVGLAGGTATGLGIGWAGWVGWLVGSGEGLLSIMGMEANTAIGVGALVAVGSVRWAVGVWAKAKKRWWKDWHRIGEGLNRDLQVGGLRLS
ncbi:hypothetical protein CVT24_003341 [Panaeolus cyanescens]|uniref:Mmc1 C-terminal domain-containing protein n=1 Tax=Panaeolus cyanescens TaxID=181874 RepID=A0A409Y773_9AGAR|nr:hypothetical protein CVT24_003341 [Panaeolus cyanescens]